MVDPNGKLGAVVRKNEDCVALATPTERRRRDGLKRQQGVTMVEVVSKSEVKYH